MKHLLALTLGVCVLGFTVSTQAADEAKKETKKERAPSAAVLKKYDKNGDGKLDDSEKEAAKKDRDALVKKYDKNADGKLDAEERKAMRQENKKDRKKSGTDSTPAPTASAAK